MYWARVVEMLKVQLSRKLNPETIWMKRWEKMKFYLLPGKEEYRANYERYMSHYEEYL